MSPVVKKKRSQTVAGRSDVNTVRRRRSTKFKLVTGPARFNVFEFLVEVE
jgi:hypothetical protein